MQGRLDNSGEYSIVMKETRMNRTAYTIVGFTFALTLALAPGALAQQ